MSLDEKLVSGTMQIKCGEELVRDGNILDKKWACSGRDDTYDDLIDKINADEL